MAGTNEYESAAQAITELLSLPVLPDGFFRTSDLIAIAACDVILEMAPDLNPMIIGFGGTLLLRLKTYHFLTVEVPAKEMAGTATVKAHAPGSGPRRI